MATPSQKEIDELIFFCEQRMKDVARMNLGAKVHKIISLNFALAGLIDKCVRFRKNVSTEDFNDMKEYYDKLGVLLAEVTGLRK
jgi:hypothetical protein